MRRLAGWQFVFAAQLLLGHRRDRESSSVTVVTVNSRSAGAAGSGVRSTMNTFQAIVNRVTHHTDSPPHVAGQVAQRLLDAAQVRDQLHHLKEQLFGAPGADAL